MKKHLCFIVAVVQILLKICLVPSASNTGGTAQEWQCRYNCATIAAACTPAKNKQIVHGRKTPKAPKTNINAAIVFYSGFVCVP